MFTLSNCLASYIVVGDAAMTALGVGGVLLTGLVCGAINGLIVIYGRLQAIVATIATGAISPIVLPLNAASKGLARKRSCFPHLVTPSLRVSSCTNTDRTKIGRLLTAFPSP